MSRAIATEREKAVHSEGVGVGMIIAAGIVADVSEVYCREILASAGVRSFQDARDLGADDYDIRRCRVAIRNLMRKSREHRERFGLGFFALGAQA